MIRLFNASVRMIYRDRQVLFWALVFPIIFAVVFGLFSFEDAPEVEIELHGDRASPLYQAIDEGLVSIEPFTVTESADPAADNVVNGEMDVAVTVDGTSVHVRCNQTNFDINRFAIAAIDQVVDEANLEAAGVNEPAVTVETTPVAGEDVTYYDFLLPGLVAMGLMNASIGGMAVAISRFREQKILRRILATPLDPNRFLAAQVGARLVLALVQTALILGVGVFIFGATIHGNVVWLFVLAVIGNLIFLNIGFSIAGRARNPDAADGMANAIALPMLFLSGTFFPTDTLPEAVQTIVAILPLTPLLEAMRIVAVDGDPITAASSQILLLAGWVVVSFAIASRLFRFQEV
ncbi:MAG TPA: ABC transporter permease [Actinomycetota bacterium]|jgi:ABC-2 type transport system permease protein